MSKKEKGQAQGTKLGGAITQQSKQRTNLIKYIKAWFRGYGWEYHHLPKQIRKGLTWQETQKLRRKEYKKHLKLQARRGW